ncbi:MAG: protein-methionine-sulfoxide reductase catalytic subunit MsrP [Alcanivoracaceae bacterium]|nr:protein-methionine-sulfoxide reductase catalytic subunit MsrP [Alcanivoracaceae bacterium]
MLIKTRKASDIPSSEITPESVYLNRRHFMAALAGGAVASGMSGNALALVGNPAAEDAGRPKWWRNAVEQRVDGMPNAKDSLTPYSDATRYNNFYEFGTGKTDPSEYAGKFKTDPWQVTIDGEVGKPGTFTLEDILKPHPLEERIYRFRCVEAWSMVVPWVGFSLADLIKRFEPTSKAKYVAFETLYDPEQMPGQSSRFSGIKWPYVEGLRLDEAMNPLTMMVVGLYGRTLPNQNGAPLRLMVPWKYGFKSIKSIVKITLTEKQPPTTWNLLAPGEYGFYSNVNPLVDHPRWSQSRERRLPNSLFDPNWHDTQMFNGYEEEVASLYKGMDLKKFY